MSPTAEELNREQRLRFDALHNESAALSPVRSEPLLAAIPSNWCDPLLTGPNAVLPKGYSYTPADVERLLNAIRERLQKAIAANKSASGPSPAAGDGYAGRNGSEVSP